MSHLSNMIKTYKNFSIFRKKNTLKENSPTHTISTKDGEEFIEIGSCWTKDYINGKFLSCQLSKAWVNDKDNTKSRKSYVIVAEEDLNNLIEIASGIVKKNVERVITFDGRDVTPSDMDMF